MFFLKRKRGGSHRGSHCAVVLKPELGGLFKTDSSSLLWVLKMCISNKFLGDLLLLILLSHF